MDNDQQLAAEKLEALRTRRFRERGERLKEERMRLGLNLIEFANLLGIHRNTQGNYEAGREPPTSYLVAAQEAGVDVAYVIDGERLSGVSSHVAQTVSTIFTRARAQGVCDLDPDAQSHLAYLVAQNNEWQSSGLPGSLEDDQVVGLIEAAFMTPREFDEAAAAIGLYAPGLAGHDPSPHERASMILETLSLYGVNKGSLGLSLHDDIRLVAEGVVASWSHLVGK